ncbi:MAG: hypothetical protein ABR616_13670 [Dermatophilaceae bacterium]
MAKSDLVGTVFPHDATRDEIADSILKFVEDNRTDGKVSES